MLQLLFITITLLSFVLFYIGTGKDKRVLLFYLLWIVIVGVLSYCGFFRNTHAIPPRLLLILIPSILYFIYFYRNINTDRVNTNYLLAIHILRIPVEYTLYHLFLQSKVPIIMTFEGWNYDIIMGFTALLLFLYTKITGKPLNRTLFIVWNVTGTVFLANIVIIAILSAPSPIQQLAFDRPNVAISQFPYTLLPAIVVPIVLLAHLLALKGIKSISACSGSSVM